MNVGTVVFLLFCATHCSESVQTSEGVFVESFLVLADELHAGQPFVTRRHVSFVLHAGRPAGTRRHVSRIRVQMFGTERVLLYLPSSQFWPMWSKSRQGIGQLSIGRATLSG